jgi:hypothetical protein
VARRPITTRTWKGDAEGDRPSLTLCRVGDTFVAPGIADEVILNLAGDRAWQSLVSNGALTVETSTGGIAGARTVTVSTKLPTGDEVPSVVELVAQLVEGETITITPATGRTLDAAGGSGALTSKKVVKTSAALVLTVACTDATATTTVDLLVNGRHEASFSLPFTPAS